MTCDAPPDATRRGCPRFRRANRATRGKGSGAEAAATASPALRVTFSCGSGRTRWLSTRRTRARNPAWRSSGRI